MRLKERPDERSDVGLRILYKLHKPVINDKHGRALSTPEEHLRKWTELFVKSITTEPVPEAIKPDYTTPVRTVRIVDTASTVSEIKHAIQHLKDGKAGGTDNIPPEI